jgi:hypothetical protein
MQVCMGSNPNFELMMARRAARRCVLRIISVWSRNLFAGVSLQLILSSKEQLHTTHGSETPPQGRTTAFPLQWRLPGETDWSSGNCMMFLKFSSDEQILGLDPVVWIQRKEACLKESDGLHGAEFLKRRLSLNWRSSPTFYGTRRSPPCSPGPATGPCSEPHESSAHPSIYFIEIHFNIIQTATPSFPSSVLRLISWLNVPLLNYTGLCRI